MRALLLQTERSSRCIIAVHRLLLLLDGRGGCLLAKIRVGGCDSRESSQSSGIGRVLMIQLLIRKTGCSNVLEIAGSGHWVRPPFNFMVVQSTGSRDI
uniref:Uncharacterized protein n=1 Tax=Romanomermis culicivorax TaxID=13658 RepID=A0A915KFM4_ROMCU